VSRRAKTAIKTVASHKFLLFRGRRRCRKWLFCCCSREFLNNHNFSATINVSINFSNCRLLFEDVRASVFRAGDKNFMDFLSTVNNSSFENDQTIRNSDFCLWHHRWRTLRNHAIKARGDFCELSPFFVCDLLRCSERTCEYENVDLNAPSGSIKHKVPHKRGK
jgi:hypothetical protein